MNSLEALQQLVCGGEENQARQQLEEWDTSLIHDCNFHLSLADLCEELGLSQRLVAELNFALRDDPEDSVCLRRLAQAHRDAGRLDRAYRCLKSLSERLQEPVQTWLEMSELLEEMERPEEARELISKALEKGPHPELLARQRNLQSQRQTQEEQALVGTNSPALLTRFLALFSGREGVYARQWAKDRQNTGYTPVRQPLTHRVAQNHLQGNHTLGVYPLRLDGTVNFVALDLDLPKSLVIRYQPGDPSWQAALARLHQYALQLQQAAGQRGLHTYLEDSGGKGRHLWCFLAQPLSARVARKLGQVWVDWGGVRPAEVNLELYPKQVSLQPDQLGNLIKLPLGIHRGSGLRGQFLNLQGEPYEDQETFLMQVERNPKDAILPLITNQPNPAWIQEAESVSEPPPPARPEPPPPYLPEQDLEFQTLLIRCATLRSLVDQAQSQNNLSHDQALVLQHTLGYLRQGVEATNFVLQHCAEIGSNYYLKSPLRGNPMSCARIRARIPGVTSRVNCNCEFPPLPSYPTPVLHLQGPAPENSAPLTLALAQDYLRARRHWQEATQQLLQVQQSLARALERQQLSQLELPQGRLRLAGATDSTDCFEVS